MLRFTPEPADAGALCYKQKMRNDLSIREEKSKDFPFIRSLTEQAFLNVPESDHTEHLLVERLRQSEAYIPELSLVAETNTGKIVGHILLSKVGIVSEQKKARPPYLVSLPCLYCLNFNGKASEACSCVKPTDGQPCWVTKLSCCWGIRITIHDLVTGKLHPTA